MPLLGPAYRLALGILLRPTEAEDAVQEAAFRAWRKIRNVRQGAEFRPWFFAIVANECRRLRRLNWWSVGQLPNLLASNDAANWSVEIVDISRAFARLNIADRQLLALRYYAGFSINETADALGVSMEAAKSRVHRALRKLRPYVAIDDAWEVS
jgi:RNA polymerase sigma-70 factor (ECF subfamily)